MITYENIKWVKDINDIHPRYPDKGIQALKHVFYKNGTEQKFSFEEWSIIVQEGENKFEEEQELREKMRNIKNESAPG
jgi:hypothetical protein|tara:strand:+ start:193 stop:426 length:234 start_codon:yes stop_codon:yes gene_type:complete